MTTDNGIGTDYIALAAEIVSAFVSNNSVPVVELPGLVASVHATLTRITGPGTEAKVEAPVPAVSVKRSVTPDFIVCLEDGKKFKSLKRHLRTRYDMTPAEYRTKWNLAADYPMVAPSYAAARSQLAKTMGLGQQRRKTAVAEPAAPPPAAVPPPARRARARASADA
ncbi:MucR family transcriptional regulator [uncultured Methylobacterium sp.]|uniref:MucR family transcriptional regulator n=1 Tax=uncultured Methylobacterium sp. TaxID=157278 RepID=UPI0035CA5D24